MKKILLAFMLLYGMNSTAQQIEKSITAANGVKIGFYEYKPTDYANDPYKKYPLIIFFHGIGERGNGTTELARVKKNAIPKYIDRGHTMTFTWNGKTETFLVLSPQLSSSYGAWPSFYGEEMIKYAKENLQVDTNRIIVTGLSLGGGGVWKYAGTSLANAKQVAAIAPVCGTKQSVNFCNIANANLPVWAFHAENDPTVNVSATNTSIDAINACNPKVKPLKTIWPTGGHAIWDRAFDTAYTWQNPNLFEWFLGQNKSLAPNVFPIANAGNDQVLSLSSNSASLDASASTDTDGKIARYIWKQVSGPVTTTIVNPISTNGKTSVSGISVTGDYVYEVKVYDDRVGYSTDMVKITLSATNSAPVAKAGSDQSITATTTYLNGSQSYDDQQIVTYRWVQLSGPSIAVIATPKSENTSISALVPGLYRFRLRVWDAEGLIDVDDVIVTQQDILSSTKKETSFLVDQPNALSEENRTALYPNPVMSSFVISSPLLNGQPATINIYTTTGQLARTEQTNALHRVTLNGSNLRQGMYYVIINTKQGQSAKLPFIKR